MKYLKKMFGKETRKQLRDYEASTYEEIAPLQNPRKDYEGYSTILIKRTDRNGRYIEVLLDNASAMQSNHNKKEYMVLVNRLGNPNVYKATGKLVRRDAVKDRGVLKKSEDKITED